MSDDIDIDTLRKKLAARRDVALARLHDTVRELYAVHAVSADEIRAILEATFRAGEQGGGGLHAVVSEPDV